MHRLFRCRATQAELPRGEVDRFPGEVKAA
jgi:hypothetical protein